MDKQDCGTLPKIVWMLWLQGWDDAPRAAQACRKSWENRNPDWVVHCLDRRALEHFLPTDIVEKILSTPKEAEASSDQIRLELLHRYGGVWADATTMCAEPLDSWLADVIPNGFFAFSRPGPDRMLSTWFLAAEKGSYIIEKWRAASWSYWQGRMVRDNYFWVHEQFAHAYATDHSFQALWDETPQISAVHRFHFGPNSVELLKPPPPDIEDVLRAAPRPVFKLTHKFETPPGPNSLFACLCEFAEITRDPPSTPARRRLLVGWFGSFSGHGTIGDLRSLEAVVSHLVGRGHEVFHATAASIAICGAVRVDWRQFSPQACDAVIFVCGPILRNHPETRAFFDYFSDVELVGVGVSLLPEGHPNHCNPFGAVFARQGGTGAFGDVAVCAPKPLSQALHVRSGEEIVVGLSLRGQQNEYGAELCLWREAGLMFDALTDLLARHGAGRVIEIENHLLRSNRHPDEIENQYAMCDLVLTTRFHGAITALRQDVPFIALDQIDGGAKVLPLLAGSGWEAVFSVNAVGALDIVRVGLALLHDPQIEQLVAVRSRLVREANKTLTHVDRWLETVSLA